MTGVLQCLGVSFRSAPVAARERLHWSPARREAFLGRLRRLSDVTEALLLCTCNRVETYVVTAHPDAGADAVIRCIAEEEPEGAATLRAHGYAYTGETAARHFFRVAAGLDAMVVGEPQILGQVKGAYREATLWGGIGPRLHALCQRCFACAKQVRTETGIGMRPVSVASVGVELARQILGDLHHARVVVVGGGEMSQEVVKHLQGAGVTHLCVVNRSPEAAQMLAAPYAATTMEWSRLPDAFLGADVLIVATGAGHAFIDAPLVAPCLAKRGRPLFFLDLAVPRNVADAVGTLPDVYLYDIDDLQRLAQDNLEARHQELARAEAIVVAAAKGLQERQAQTKTVAPLIGQLHRKCEAIRQEEVAKTLARFPSADPQWQEALAACTSAIVAKILHDPILRIKEGEQAGETEIQELRKLFRLHELPSS